LGQKVNPISLRVAVNKDWRSRWYADKADYADYVIEDIMIREMVMGRMKDASVPEVLIERYSNRVRVTILTARPGAVIGRKGEDVDLLRAQIAEVTGKEIYIEIAEVKDPDCNAKLVAESIALQMERRISYRRAMKRAVQLAMENGALGIRIHMGGRLGGAELARDASYMEGKVPLHTLRANVDYGFVEANTMAGKIGVKVWICKQPEEAQNQQKGKETEYASFTK
jgi:small subunit ribosomal protein S3